MPGASVQFDVGPLLTGSVFRDPVGIITAWHAAEVDDALIAMQQAQADGMWLAGSASYELGYALIPRLAARMPPDRTEPLLRFGVFAGVAASGPSSVAAPARLGPLQPEWTLADYTSAFDAVQAYLRSGDIYQANLTFPLTLAVEGALSDLYQHLKRRQPVPYGAFVDLGDVQLLSRSPELFFALTADGNLRTRPMKGTIRRGNGPAEDAALRAQLADSEKNQAENLMITDLLRNDFGQIAEIGSVKVPKLFAIESYATVHQMTSEVTARLLPDQTLADIFRAVFPCGSITGAPKIRAMEIIADLEPAPRGSYTGAIGWIAPDGAMEFSVAIRTLICATAGQATLNVGGGVVYDSTAADEYAEALLKAAFTQNLG
ncbi:aminodeoxychorismate synthase component I [Loktanella sp. SALINAS62]|uniref:aminodeoxychorismate synthase component I n=1 Tax=Loktanella sp. SALINAS62 TaxID=2706124 RepID=UPI001B8D6620|nr:aminodeoxychorismate synthase component I [Loktanella sp. SALINAS62]MBS1300855.1 aminodeoxychorismate synthase component I [Loktanella sp. SALINAS62]